MAFDNYVFMGEKNKARRKAKKLAKEVADKNKNKIMVRISKKLVIYVSKAKFNKLGAKKIKEEYLTKNNIL